MEDRYPAGPAGSRATKTTETTHTVGSRELKTRLGTYLRRAREGESFVVTDRGRPVAELRPYTTRDNGLATRLHELSRVGIVAQEVAERLPLDGFQPIEGRGESASAALLEEREDRF